MKHTQKEKDTPTLLSQVKMKLIKRITVQVEYGDSTLVTSDYYDPDIYTFKEMMELSTVAFERKYEISST